MIKYIIQIKINNKYVDNGDIFNSLNDAINRIEEIKHYNSDSVYKYQYRIIERTEEIKKEILPSNAKSYTTKTNIQNKVIKPTKNNYDNVQNPQHYTDTQIEPISVIEDWNLGFCLGNAIKYIKRAGHKKSSSMSMIDKEINDINKALWYIKRHLKNLKKKQNKIKGNIKDV